MSSVSYKSKIKEHGLVLLFFTVLTLILTYPVVVQLTTYPAGDGGDTLSYIWTIWHVNRVLTGDGSISDLYYSNLLFYPQGVSLMFYSFSLTNTLFLAFPLTLIIDNLVFIYNILFLFHFIMAGYAMYLLIKYLVKDGTVAFLVGFAYTFSPLHMIRSLGHVNIMSFCWTPLFLLFFFKIFEEKKMSNAIIAAIFLFFLALSSWYHLVFAFFIAVPYFIYKLITNRCFFTGYFFARIAVFLFLFGAIISPFVLPIISEYFSRTETVARLGTSAISFINYVLPSILHPLWGEGIIRYYPSLGGVQWLAEIVVTPGYLVILICLLFLVRVRKHIFWFLLAIFFLLLSVNFQGLAIFLLRSIPFINVISQLGLFAFGVLFAILIFFAFGLRYFLAHSFLVKIPKKAVATIIFIILATEYFAMPYPTPDRYYRHTVIKFAEEIGEVVKGPHPVLYDDFSVLPFPPQEHVVQNNMYFQIFHNKPIFGGNISITNQLERRTFLEYKRFFSTNDIDGFQEFLEEYSVGYIVIYGQEYATLFLSWEVPGRFVFAVPDIEIYVFEFVSE